MSQSFKERCDIMYDKGTPIISDAQYDNLFGEGATIGRPGYSEDIKHPFQMYSLQKHYTEDGEPPIPVKDCIKTPKLDGAACCLVYIDGELSRATTRGDGIAGKVITEKLKLLVPNSIKTNEPLIQITGEIVALASVENSRNQAAGSLGLKSIEDFKIRMEEIGLKFIAYSTTSIEASYKLSLAGLALKGFSTVIGDCSGFPTDGEVYRIERQQDYIAAGFTSKHPKGAFAWKEKQEVVQTKLLDVIWQVGKSGKATPIAILDPVVIGEATVAKATLNNMAFIDNLGLTLGCTVELIRAGEIIPEIVGRAD